MIALKKCLWIGLALVLGLFVFVAFHWFSYCPPTAALKFAFGGAWFREPFYQGHAGLVLDQPTVGKFLLWNSVLSVLACTLVWFLHAVVDLGRPGARRGVTAATVVLSSVVAIELLAPTFLLVQYVLSMGVTVRRVLGLCLCGVLGALYLTVIFWSRKTDSPMTPTGSNPLVWAWACSLVVPTYYLREVLYPFAWHHWDGGHTAFLLAWVALVAPLPCLLWLTRRKRTA